MPEAGAACRRSGSAPASPSWPCCCAGARARVRSSPPCCWSPASSAADLGVNNGPNESTALPPEIYDVLRPETTQRDRRRAEATDGPAGRVRHGATGSNCSAWASNGPMPGMVHGFDHTLGYNPLRLADFSDAVGTRDTIAGPDQRKFTALFPSYRCRLADLLGLRYIASPVPIEQVDDRLHAGDLRLVARTKQGYVYENPARPAARAVRRRLADRRFRGDEAQRPAGPMSTRLRSCCSNTSRRGPRRSGRLRHRSRPTSGSPATRTPRSRSRSTAAQAGFVVLNDIWHPWWRAHGRWGRRRDPEGQCAVPRRAGAGRHAQGPVQLQPDRGRAGRSSARRSRPSPTSRPARAAGPSRQRTARRARDAPTVRARRR